MRFWPLLLVPVALATAQPEAWRLATTTATYTFSPANGGIISLVDRRDEHQLAAAGDRSQLFELALTDPADPTGKRTSLTNLDRGEVSALRGPNSLALTWRNLGGRDLVVTVTFEARPGDPLLRCRLKTSVPAGSVLEFVRFPVVNLAAPLHADGADAFVCGNTKGGVYQRPSAWKVGRYQAFGQPGNLAAAFGCYYDAAGGLYTAALDSGGTPKGIAAARTDQGLALQWYSGCYAKDRYELDYEVVLAPFHGAAPLQGAAATDWRDAADLYRAWAEQQPWAARPLAQREDLPAWLRSGPAMVRFNRDWLSRPAEIKSWLDDYYRRYFAGVPLTVAFWGWEKVSTWITPDYFPCYPSDEVLADLTQQIRAVGGHTFYWPSGYHYTVTFDKRPDGSFVWDDRARFDAEARAHAITGRNGQVTIGDRSWLRGGQTACQCPGDPWTLDWFNQIVGELARRGGELVQVDQVVGGNYPACYNPAHGHPLGPGRWQTAVFRRQLATMREVGRKVQPDFVACFEEPNEWYLDQIGWQDYRDWETLRQADVQPASVFGYVYHDYVPQFQSNPRLGDRLQMAYELVNGQVPQFVPDHAVGPGPLLTGDMEEFAGDVPRGWDRVSGWQGVDYTGVAARDEAEKHSGAASLRLTNTQAGQIVQVSRNLNVGAGLMVGHTYRLSAWLRSRDVAAGSGAALGLFAPGLRSTGSANLAYPPAEAGWRQSSAEFTVAPTTEILRIMLHLQGPGTVWIDDLRLEEKAADGAWAEVRRPDLPGDHDLMRQWVPLFHGAGRPYLLLGRMLAPPKLDCETFTALDRTWPTIWHNAWRAPDGSRAVVLVNVTDEPRTGRLTWNGTTQSLTLKPWEVRLVR